MARRLVQLDGDRVLGSTRVGSRELLIGRDPEADVVVESGLVSREHALVEPCDGGHAIRDLGSANGTRVNGTAISGRVRLAPGDEIELGNARFVYEEGPGGPGRAAWLGGGAALLLLLGALFAFWPRADSTLAAVVSLAEEALVASGRGNSKEAKRALNGAVALLVSQGYLDDVPPQQARKAALELIESHLDRDVDLVAIYESAIHGTRERRETQARSPRRGPCRTDRVSREDLALCIRERAEGILFDLWQDPREIPESFYEAVDEQFWLVLGKRRSWVEQSLDRGQRLRPMMEAELEAAKMPKLLHYLSMIESGYEPAIRSPAGARGLWQFMPATGRSYGLRVDGTVDDRTDPRKSTRAAARYLRDLAFEFGGDALLLAIASYNKGENGIRRALKKLDDPRTDRSYWTLAERGLIPRETQDYVPRLVAAAVMGEAGVPSEQVLPPS